MGLNEELQRTKKQIDEALKGILIEKELYQKKVLEAIEYSLFTGGKRLRPVMAIKSYEMFGSDMTEIMPFAIGIEMIHTYSLIHDDLPAMDNDDFRRGMPTNHRIFGDAIAILAGDGLLNLSHEVILDFINNNARDADDFRKYNKALWEISRYSGVYGMIGGQVVDLSSKAIDEDELLFMYKAKTAALIQSALVSGALVGEANSDEIEHMRNFGLNLGLAYQIRDDILDMDKDKGIEKITYLTFFNKKKAETAIEEYSEKAMEELNKLSNRDTRFFIDLTKKLIDRNL
ncbi:MAG: polyprenyl synthetase family protein [Tissierellaceae bacterium]